jgi:uncharacterized protein YqjF (DUF2071 family)
VTDLSELLSAPARQASSLEETSHRPWPLPGSSWVMGQTWDDLLFAHWRVTVETLRPHVPPELELETHDGSAWLGITPFRVTGLRARGMLALPFVSSFLELNCRTYVRHGDRPGIWFFSLDASSAVAVAAARRTYRLPYFHARMSVERRGGLLNYECARTSESGRAFSGAYRGTGTPSAAAPGTLDHFLTERYCLYAHDATGLHRADIHHRPWPLQPAEATIDLSTIAPIELPDTDPLLHFSSRQDVVIWPLVRIV